MAPKDLPTERARQRVDLPPRLFLYTLDQVGTLIAVERQQLIRHVHYDGRSVGAPKPDKLLARNIASDGEPPEWRVAEREFVRWLRHKKFRIYENPWGVG